MKDKWREHLKGTQEISNKRAHDQMHYRIRKEYAKQAIEDLLLIWGSDKDRVEVFQDNRELISRLIYVLTLNFKTHLPTDEATVIATTAKIFNLSDVNETELYKNPSYLSNVKCHLAEDPERKKFMDDFFEGAKKVRVKKPKLKPQ